MLGRGVPQRNSHGLEPPVRTIGFQPVAPRAHRPAESRVNRPSPTRNTPPPAVVEQACQPVRQSGEAHRHDELSVGFDCDERTRVNRAVFAKGTDRPGGLSPQRKPTQRSATRVFRNEGGCCRASRAAERLNQVDPRPQQRQHPAGGARQHGSKRLTSATNRHIPADQRTTGVPTKSHRLCDFSATPIFQVQIVLPTAGPPTPHHNRPQRGHRG